MPLGPRRGAVRVHVVGLGLLAGTAWFGIRKLPDLARLFLTSIAQPSSRSRLNSPAKSEFEFENSVQFENIPSGKARSFIVNTQELVYHGASRWSKAVRHDHLS